MTHSPCRLLLLSNSRNADAPFLSHAREAVAEHFRSVSSACFVPFAGVTLSSEEYTAAVQRFFEPLGVAVHPVPAAAGARAVVEAAEAIVVGGGNTFRLLEQCQRYDIVHCIGDRVRAGVPYLGWSAGSVLACPTIGTTNDMPIVAPSGFAALGLVPFQINPHFTDAHPAGFRGETRRQRLAEYVALNPDVTVVGLPEGNWLDVTGSSAVLGGLHPTPWFAFEGDGMLLAGDEMPGKQT